MELTNEHFEILLHAQKNKVYCGSSKELDDLFKLKMMERIGRKSFVPSPYYRLLPDGESALEDLKKLKGWYVQSKQKT